VNDACTYEVWMSPQLRERERVCVELINKRERERERIVDFICFATCFIFIFRYLFLSRIKTKINTHTLTNCFLLNIFVNLLKNKCYVLTENINKKNRIT